MFVLPAVFGWTLSGCGSSDKLAQTGRVQKPQERQVQVLAPVPSVAEIAVEGNIVYWFGGRTLYSHDLKTGRRRTLMTVPKKVGYEGLEARGGRVAFRAIRYSGKPPTAVYAVAPPARPKVLAKGKSSTKCGRDVSFDGFSPDGGALVLERKFNCSGKHVTVSVISYAADGRRRRLYAKSGSGMGLLDEVASVDVTDRSLVLSGKKISIYDLKRKKTRTLMKGKHDVQYWATVSPNGKVAATEAKWNGSNFKEKGVIFTDTSRGGRRITVRPRKNYAMNMRHCGERVMIAWMRNSSKRPRVEIQPRPGSSDWTDVLAAIGDSKINRVITWGCDADTLVLGVTRKGEKRRRLIAYPIG